MEQQDKNVKIDNSVLLINEPSGAWVGTSLHIIMYEDYSTTVPAPRKYIPLSTWLLRVKVMIFLLGAFHYLKKLKISSRPKKMKAAEPKALLCSEKPLSGGQDQHFATLFFVHVKGHR